MLRYHLSMFYLHMHTYKLSIEYLGTSFSGWQKQKNATTVQYLIEEALSNFSGNKINAHAAGRTDAGVHAIAMPVSFKLPKYYEPIRVQHALNFFLKPNPIAVFNVEYLGENSSFHARFSAKSRTYLYKIQQRTHPLTFNKNLHWWVKYELNLEKMQQAANLLIGTHDFSTFRAQGCQAKSPIKTINSIKLHKLEDVFTITITANSFLYHQVRNIVGSLYYVGNNKWNITDFYNNFMKKDRFFGGPTAPPYGLYFFNANY